MKIALFLIALLALKQGAGQDEAILEKGEKLLDEAKAAYEDAHAKGSVSAFVDAGFKLEEARIKFIVLQEIGSPDRQKIAADRLRAVNQLSKLIHDGKVAVNRPPPAADPAPAKPGEPAAAPAPKPAPAPARVADVTKRVSVPDAARQKEAEKLVKELFKEPYAKKAPADRQALAALLLQQAVKTADDPAAAWVLCRESQDISAQLGHIRGTIKAIETAALLFDIDAFALKQTALTAAAKTVKTPVDSADLAAALLELTDELIAADQYEAADKATALAVQAAKKSNEMGLLVRATTRAKEVSEAKSRYLAMKNVLQTLAKNPEDPAANNEMGQFLCFVKGSWDLGLRFLAKGSDATMKGLAEKELAMSGKAADQVALADGWWELMEKEKSPLRKSQMLARAGALYELAYLGATGLTRTKVEKRLAEADAANTGPNAPVNLLRLIDPTKDTVSGQWRLENGALLSSAGNAHRLMIPYQPPEEYDVTMVVSRRTGTDNISMGLVFGGAQFNLSIDAHSGQGGVSLIELIEGVTTVQSNPAMARGLFVTGSEPHAIVYSVRKDRISAAVNGRTVLSWEPAGRRLLPPTIWKLPDNRAMSVGVWGVEISVSRLILTPVTGQGKKLR